MKWENQYVVFDVTKGPKVIIETLDTYGDEGWECCSMLSIARERSARDCFSCFLKIFLRP